MQRPFEDPPTRQLRPRVLESSHEADADTIEWLFAEKNLNVPADSPLGRWLRNRRRGATGQELEAAGAVPPAPGRVAGGDLVTRAAIADLYGAQMLAWSIRVLCAKRNEKLITVDGSVWRHELLGKHQSEAQLPMPGAAATLYQAARLHQAGGGRMRVCGKGSVGTDIEWEPAVGGKVVIERKDRALEAAAYDDDERWLGFFRKYLHAAAPKLAKRRPAARVISFGFIGTPTRTKELQVKWKQLVTAQLGKLSPQNAPDAFYGAFVGYGIEGGQLDAVDHGHLLEVVKEPRTRPAHWDSISRVLHMAYDPRYRRNGNALEGPVADTDHEK